MIRQCSCLTRKRKPCPINADRCVSGVWYCHLHDPGGTFRAQVAAARKPKQYGPKPGMAARAMRLRTQELEAQEKKIGGARELDREMDDAIARDAKNDQPPYAYPTKTGGWIAPAYNIRHFGLDPRWADVVAQ